MDEENKQNPFERVSYVTIDESSDGQRVDNFLFKLLKQVPRSYVYKILRKGEVRIDKKRAKPTRKLSKGNVVRIPPVRLTQESEYQIPQAAIDGLNDLIVAEDDFVMVVNKPSGLAVHGGSGVRYGLIELVRQARKDMGFVELAHRLDRNTSGLIVIAKSRQTLLELHELFKQSKQGLTKQYYAHVSGRWAAQERELKHYLDDKNKSSTGRVQIGQNGKIAISQVKLIEKYEQSSLLEVTLVTGRMHQIRAQLAHEGHPIIGDDRYGDFKVNRTMKKEHGIKRLCLHAFHVRFALNVSNKNYDITVPLPEKFLIDEQ